MFNRNEPERFTLPENRSTAALQLPVDPAVGEIEGVPAPQFLIVLSRAYLPAVDFHVHVHGCVNMSMNIAQYANTSGRSPTSGQ